MNDPFPIDGTLEVRDETDWRVAVPCEVECLTDHPTGDLTVDILEEVLQFAQPPVEVDFTVYEHGTFEFEQDLMEIES